MGSTKTRDKSGRESRECSPLPGLVGYAGESDRDMESRGTAEEE